MDNKSSQMLEPKGFLSKAGLCSIRVSFLLEKEVFISL